MEERVVERLARPGENRTRPELIRIKSNKKNKVECGTEDVKIIHPM